MEWNGFLDSVCNPENGDQEIVAWLFSTSPYGSDERWIVYEVKAVPVDFDGDGFAEGWKPDKKDFARVKRQARKEELTKIGNIHTHPSGPRWSKVGFYGSLLPSDVDLKFMRKFDQTVRGVISVEYWPETYRSEAKAEILGILFHDQYGKTLYAKRVTEWPVSLGVDT